MNQNASIDYPKQVECILNKESGTYNVSVQLKNNSPLPIFFYVVSTFGKFIKELTNLRQIESNCSATLQFMFKSTNIISKKDEQLVIFLSQSKSVLSSPTILNMRCNIRLLFLQDFVQDNQIEQIIEQQIQSLIAQAYLIRSKGSIKEAKHLYEQGFLLMRKQHSSLYHMAICECILRQWPEALKAIQTALIFDPQNCHYQLIKAKILQDWFPDPKGWQVELLDQSFRLLSNIKRYNFFQLSEQEQTQVKTRYQLFIKNSHINRMSILKQGLFQQAIYNYSESHLISKCFGSKAIFEKELKEIIFSELQIENMTPQEIIDPISYEIMENPYILPSGYSIDLKNLQMYFKTNGPKDPITRMDIQPHWLFPNNNLHSYIKNNPKLKLWMQYEYDIVHK